MTTILQLYQVAAAAQGALNADIAVEKPSIMPFQDLRGAFPMDFPLYMDPYYFHVPLGDSDLGIGRLRETDRPIP